MKLVLITLVSSIFVLFQSTDSYTQETTSVTFLDSEIPPNEMNNEGVGEGDSDPVPASNQRCSICCDYGVYRNCCVADCAPDKSAECWCNVLDKAKCKCK